MVVQAYSRYQSEIPIRHRFPPGHFSQHYQFRSMKCRVGARREGNYEFIGFPLFLLLLFTSQGSAFRHKQGQGHTSRLFHDHSARRYNPLPSKSLVGDAKPSTDDVRIQVTSRGTRCAWSLSLRWWGRSHHNPYWESSRKRRRSRGLFSPCLQERTPMQGNRTFSVTHQVNLSGASLRGSSMSCLATGLKSFVSCK